MKFYLTGLAIGFAVILFGGIKGIESAFGVSASGRGMRAGTGVGTSSTTSTSSGCGCGNTTGANAGVGDVAVPSGPSKFVRAPSQSSPAPSKAAPLPVDFERSVYPLGYSTFLE